MAIMSTSDIYSIVPTTLFILLSGFSLIAGSRGWRRIEGTDDIIADGPSLIAGAAESENDNTS